PGPPAVEVTKRVADASSTAEVVHTLADRVEGAVEVAVAKQPRDPCEPGREDECLQVLAARDRMGEDHQQPRVALHRPAYVADEHERPAPHPRLAAKKGHQLAAGADRVPRRPAQVDAARA